MKYENTNQNKIFKGKSFYIIIALCLIAIGAATWMSFNSIENDESPMPESSVTQPSESTTDPVIPNEELPPADRVDNEAKEPYETPSQPSEEDVSDMPVAKNFVLPLNGNIAKNFSGDTLVYSATYRDMRVHNGIDISGSEGAEIKASGNGTVVAIIDDAKLGKYVEIDHGDGLTARYCGLDTVAVKEGDTVDAVTKLGTLGAVHEETLDAIHLHLEFYKDQKPVDPLSVIYPAD